jgi:flagellar biosynthesis regulator FlaF
MSDQTSEEELFWQRASDDNRLTRELDEIMTSLGIVLKKEIKEIEKKVKNLEGS